MKKKGLWLVLIGMVISLTAEAQHRSEAEAREIASKYLQSINGKAPRRQLQRASFTGPRRGGAVTEDNAYYIFNDTEGNAFVIISADERLKDVLGHCDRNTFEADAAPEALKRLLDEYADQYELVQGEPVGERRTVQRKLPNYLITDPLPYKNVSPLIKTTWGQRYPYNKYCPKLGTQRCITGCLATAMAQVMNYHKYPDVGSGTMSYTSKTNSITLDADFDDPDCYDWDNMRLSYSGSYSTAQADAVANLMKLCGIGLGMDYGTDWSEADYSDIPYPMHTFFGYSRNVVYLQRNCFKSDEWVQVITNELLHGRPVIYNGNDDDNGGHSFVLDGVRNKNRFHINWGWDGNYDGYFALDALSPYSGMDYTLYHCAIINISPTDVGVHQDIYYADDFSVSATQVRNSQRFTATLHNVWNYSNSATSKIDTTTFKGYMGIATYTTEMELIRVLTKNIVNNRMYWGWGEMTFEVSISSSRFPQNDSCYVVPVIINSMNEVTPIRTLNGETDAVLAVKKSSTTMLLKTLTQAEEEAIDAIVPTRATKIQEGSVFDLSGRKMNSATPERQRQIVVKNGKKYVSVPR